MAYVCPNVAEPVQLCNSIGFRMAIRYIYHLQSCLDDDMKLESLDPEMLEYQDASPSTSWAAVPYFGHSYINYPLEPPAYHSSYKKPRYDL